MSTTTEFAELHRLIGDMRRCVTAVASKYGDSPATRRVVNDADRILLDIDRLEIDAEELGMRHGVPQQTPGTEKIGIPDTQYGSEFWQDVADEGLGGYR
jgi:hypothetical protein